MLNMFEIKVGIGTSILEQKWQRLLWLM
jgi:hypothetical protein